MIAPRTIAQMVAASRLEQTRAAIVATLRPLLVGVAIESHPGKLDINDVVGKAIVRAPGIMLGWTRARAARAVDGSQGTAVEWTAYIVTEDLADRATRTALPRDAVAYGIGATLLEILADADLPLWDLACVSPPAAEQPPDLKPVMTARSYEAGTTIYAVTWTQTIEQTARSLFRADTPAIDADGGIGFGAAGMPPELAAIIKQADAEGDDGP